MVFVTNHPFFCLLLFSDRRKFKAARNKVRNTQTVDDVIDIVIIHKKNLGSQRVMSLA